MIQMADFIESGEKFEIGSALGRTWSTLWARPGVFLGLTLIPLVVPSVLMRVMMFAFFRRYAFFFVRYRDFVRIFTSLLSMTFMLLFQGTITYAVFQIFMEGGASVKESFRRSCSRVPTLLLMIVLAMVCFGVGAIISIMFIFFIGFNNVFWTIIVLISATAALCAVVCKWYVAPPVCVVERMGALKSLNRSGHLTKGRRLKIFGMLLLLIIVSAIITSIVRFILNRTIGSEFVGTLIEAVANAVPMALFNIMPVTVYYGLRVEKENLTASSLADIFD